MDGQVRWRGDIILNGLRAMNLLVRDGNENGL